MIDRLVVLGASGDLTGRYLLPALAELQEAQTLPDGLQVVGVARNPWDADAFREYARARLDDHGSHIAQQARRRLVDRLDYVRGDATDPDAIAQASGSKPVLAYLALPPAGFAPAIRALAEARLAEPRIVIEKPFGEDLQSARELNRLLHDTFPEKSIFRIDHFLGMQTVQNFLGLRFANRLFEPVWNNHHVERVEIVWDETLALEGRAGYYDTAGALKDMIQNHLLQLLCLFGMEAPITLSDQDLRDRKVDLLRAVRQMSVEEVDNLTVRGRYGAGRAGDRDTPAYIDEEGVDASRDTETFASVTLNIDNWRWAGVPFTLRSGKALGSDRREIVVHFKPVPHLVFGQSSQPVPNVLHVEMDPDKLTLEINLNGSGDPFELDTAGLSCALAPQKPSAYARLLLDALNSQPTLSIRDDEAEESWRIVEPILARWAQGHPPLVTYPAGSDGPSV